MLRVEEIKDWTQMVNKVVCGNVLDALRLIPDDSIDCIVTSPPYWGLRFYGEEAFTVWGGDLQCDHEWEFFLRDGISGGRRSEKVKVKGMENFQLVPKTRQGFCLKCGAWWGQLGLEPSLDMYLEHMLRITAELKRILKPSGVLFWNHGDNYSTTPPGNTLSNYEKWAQIGDGLVGRLAKRNQYGAGVVKANIPRKSLCLQNYRLAVRMVDEQGWILRNIIIWHVPNAMPESVKDRFVVDYEPVFFFVKSPKYYFEQQYEPYTQPLNRWGREILKARGVSMWDAGTGQNTYRDRNLRPNPLGRIKRSVWSIPTEPLKEAHFAAYPTRLVEVLLRAGCPKAICVKCGQPRRAVVKTEVLEFNPREGEKYSGGTEFMSDKTTLRSQVQKVFAGWEQCDCGAEFVPGIVLDPFLGSGTTAVVAEQLGLRWIGIEINPQYCEIAERRLLNVYKRLFPEG